MIIILPVCLEYFIGTEKNSLPTENYACFFLSFADIFKKIKSSWNMSSECHIILGPDQA